MLTMVLNISKTLEETAHRTNQQKMATAITTPCGLTAVTALVGKPIRTETIKKIPLTKTRTVKSPGGYKNLYPPEYYNTNMKNQGDKYNYFTFPNQLDSELFYYYLFEFKVIPEGIDPETITKIFTAMCEDYVDGNISARKLSNMADRLLYSSLSKGYDKAEPKRSALMSDIAEAFDLEDNEKLVDKEAKEFLAIVDILPL